MDKFLEDFFGLDVLRKHAGRVLASELSTGAQWLSCNLQPVRYAAIVRKQKQGPHECPHYQLLEAVAEMLLIQPAEFGAYQEFCGVFVNRGRSRLPIMTEGGYRSFDLVVTACHALDLVLRTALGYLEMEQPRRVMVDEETSLANMPAASVLMSDWRKYLIGREILAVWKKSVPQVCLCDESEKSAIEAVRNFQRSLRQNCTADSSFLYPICAQAPTAFDMQQHREEFISLQELSRGGDAQNEP